MLSRNEFRELCVPIGLAPSIAAHLAGLFPSLVSDWLTGKRELSPEAGNRLELTVTACLELASETELPIKWANLEKTKVAVFQRRKKLMASHIAEISRREFRSLGV